VNVKFPIAIHKDPGSSYGVTVPDFPGCFSAGETIEDAATNAVEAIDLWVETALEDKVDVRFEPSSIEVLRKNPDFADAVWVFVDIDPSKIGRAAAPRYTLDELVAQCEPDAPPTPDAWSTPDA
jgi:predicted RNase H-like HicB family nuclease